MPGPAHVFATNVENFVLRRQGVFPRRHFENSSPRRLLLSGSPALKTPILSVNLEDDYGQVYLMSRRDEGQGIIACFIPCSLDPAGGKTTRGNISRAVLARAKSTVPPLLRPIARWPAPTKSSMGR